MHKDCKFVVAQALHVEAATGGRDFVFLTLTNAGVDKVEHSQGEQPIPRSKRQMSKLIPVISRSGSLSAKG